jgi:hypothetical protein
MAEAEHLLIVNTLQHFWCSSSMPADSTYVLLENKGYSRSISLAERLRVGQLEYSYFGYGVLRECTSMSAREMRCRHHDAQIQRDAENIKPPQNNLIIHHHQSKTSFRPYFIRSARPSDGGTKVSSVIRSLLDNTPSQRSIATGSLKPDEESAIHCCELPALPRRFGIFDNLKEHPIIH